MTQKPLRPQALLQLIDESLTLIQATHPPMSSVPTTQQLAEPLPSLYKQCLEVTERAQKRPPEPVRTIHHFASTGGTLICRYIAATPNVRLISEIDPLSPMTPLRFSPSDLIMLYRNTVRPVEDETLEDIFRAGLEKIHTQAERSGERLVLRDHTHSHFCTGPGVPDRMSLRDIVQATLPVKSVVTVRHPLDSFLSMQANKWVHFSPFTLDEYARRYLLFLDTYDDLPVVKYEDFVSDSQATMRRLCEILDLVLVPDLDQVTEIFKLTGDSGRKSKTVEHRARREVPQAIQAERQTSAAYAQLCQRLAYDP